MEAFSTRWRQPDGWEAPLPDLDGPSTLVLAFGASWLADRPGPLAELAAAYPRSCVLGCSTAGAIEADTIHDDALVVTVVRFVHTRLAIASEELAGTADSAATGERLAASLRSRLGELSALLVLSDGLEVNGSELARGLSRAAGGAVVTGGLAADGDRFERTWVLVDGEPRQGRVCAVGLAGDELVVRHGSRGGWDIFGPERRVTRAEGNVLRELDGQPALGLYRRYLGDLAAGLPATALLFPLEVRSGQDDPHPVVRTVLGIDEDNQTMTFAGDVPEGSLARLMRANFDRIIDGALEAAEQAQLCPLGGAAGGTAETGPSVAIAVSCVGRRLLLGERTEEELEAAQSGLPGSTVLCGYYSYGEISPVASGSCDLHNQTMTLTLLSERTPRGG